MSPGKWILSQKLGFKKPPPEYPNHSLIYCYLYHCISYHLLCSKLPQNLMASKHLLSHSSMSQESRCSFVGFPWLRISHKASVKLLARAAMVSKLRKRIHFQDHSVVVGRIQFFMGCWTECPSFLVTWVSLQGGSQHGSLLHQNEPTRERGKMR